MGLIERLKNEECSWCSSGTCAECQSLFKEAAAEIGRLQAVVVEYDDLIAAIETLADLMADSTELRVKETSIVQSLNELCRDSSTAAH